MLQMVEDVEKGLLRFRRRDFLNIVDDQYVYRLVEVDEIIGGVVDDGVSELRLKHMADTKSTRLSGNRCWMARPIAFTKWVFPTPDGHRGRRD